MSIDFDALTEPFDEKLVKWRLDSTYQEQNGIPTKGWAVPYIDARDVAERLDSVVGPEAWSDDYEIIGQKSMKCSLTFFDDDFPNGQQSKVGTGEPAGNDNPAKSAESDALKRAALKWGVARYIYRSNRAHVDIIRKDTDTSVYAGSFNGTSVYFEPPSIDLQDNSQKTTEKIEKPDETLVSAVLDLALEVGDLKDEDYVSKILQGVEKKFDRDGLQDLTGDEAADALKEVASKDYLERIRERLADTKQKLSGSDDSGDNEEPPF